MLFSCEVTSDFATPQAAACQASSSLTISQSLLKSKFYPCLVNHFRKHCWFFSVLCLEPRGPASSCILVPFTKLTSYASLLKVSNNLWQQKRDFRTGRPATLSSALDHSLPWNILRVVAPLKQGFSRWLPARGPSPLCPLLDLRVRGMPERTPYHECFHMTKPESKEVKSGGFN